MFPSREYARLLTPVQMEMLLPVLPAGSLVLVEQANNLPGQDFWAFPGPDGWGLPQLETYATDGNGVLLEAAEIEPTGFPTIDGNYYARVHGFVMLQKVTAGDYRVEFRNGVASFYKPKGTKCIVAHRAASITYGRQAIQDLNRIAYHGPADEATVQALAACPAELAVGGGYDLAHVFESSKYDDYTSQVRVVEVHHDTKEYVLQTNFTNRAVHPQNRSRRPFADVHKQLAEDPRLTRVSAPVTAY